MTANNANRARRGHLNLPLGTIQVGVKIVLWANIQRLQQAQNAPIVNYSARP
jgi:hypothetical protein